MRTANRSPGTIALRTFHVRRVLDELGVETLGDVTTEQLVELLANKRWKPNTRRSYRASLRTFFSWARASGLIERSPVDLIPAPQLPRSKPHPLPEPAYRTALQVARYDQRLRVAIQLGGQCGLRRGEIAQVHRDDVVEDLVGSTLRVIGKGGHERYVPLPAELADQLLALPRDWLFPSPRIPGRHATSGAVGRWISSVLPAGYTTHSLRHRCGTMALRNSGGDLRAVQELLGHAKAETTQIYTLIGQDAIRAAMESAA
jgi:integrase/recombinase XerC